MADTDQTELIRAAQSGDAKAFEVLLGRYYNDMFKMAYKYCGNENDAYDITQEACIKLACGLDGYKGDSAFTSWLYRIVINTAKDWFKSQSRHPSNPDVLEFVSVENKAEDQEYARQVMAFIYQLPEGEKDALLLVMSEGLSHKQAAEILQVKESTVSWRIHEARKKLSAAFEDKEHSHGS